MKKTIFYLLTFISTYSKSQVININPDSAQKPEYKYIIIYREWVLFNESFEYNYRISRHWETKTELFLTLNELVSWLNGDIYYSGREIDRYVLVPEDRIISVYRLSDSNKIKLKMKEVTKYHPKRIEVEEEKWVEQKYEITK